MKQEDTKKKILDKALELFSQRGYDAVSVGEIAAAVGIKAPSLYNHFSGKQAIFEAIVETTAAQYQRDTDRIHIHVQDADRDIPAFVQITEEELFEKVRQIFDYSLHEENIRRFRKMMTIEQYRDREFDRLAAVVAYHAAIFRSLIQAGALHPGDPDALALLYAAPVITLIGICDRQPEREEECREMLRAHVHQFYTMVQAE